MRRLMRVVLGALFRVCVSGLQQNPDTRRLLVLANYESFPDGFLPRSLGVSKVDYVALGKVAAI